MEQEKQRASLWFQSLRDEICDAFEQIECSQIDGPCSDLPVGKFVRSETKRNSNDGTDGGGGEMSVMTGGRIFEKVGVNISTVFGALSKQAQQNFTSRKDIQGLEDDPRFWASGISLVAHMNSPHVPAIHMNTRMFWTPSGWWFGGGSDLNPMIPNASDTDFFHNTLKQACDQHDTTYYSKFKAWADEYFFIKHRGEARGVGGIFYDDLCTGNWEDDFSFTQSVGDSFLKAYLPLVNQHKHKKWSDSERDIQLVKRGRYAEFNLVYDRGTHFGLQSGHNVDAALMSMPPVAKWP